METLRDESGQLVEDETEQENMEVSYYVELFRTDASAGGKFIVGEFPLLEEGEADELERECTEEEVLKALRSMGSYKVPGPDGFQAVFLKRFWNVTGTAVLEFVRGIMRGGEILVEAAKALLVLVPKEVKPCSLQEFGPLTLCNIVYKLISKVIVSRLKKIRGSLISPFQASFVLGRQSIGNFIICQ